MRTEEHLQQQYQLLSSDVLIGGMTQELLFFILLEWIASR